MATSWTRIEIIVYVKIFYTRSCTHVGFIWLISNLVRLNWCRHSLVCSIVGDGGYTLHCWIQVQVLITYMYFISSLKTSMTSTQGAGSLITFCSHLTRLVICVCFCTRLGWLFQEFRILAAYITLLSALCGNQYSCNCKLDCKVSGMFSTSFAELP